MTPGAALKQQEAENDDLSRVHYITRRGRNVKWEKDLYENYECLQQSKVHEANDMSTQWSLKQGLKYLPTKTKIATISELTQLHNLEVFEPVNRSSLSK
jgi:hypothetical protein